MGFETVGTVDLQTADESAADSEPSNPYSLPKSAQKECWQALCCVLPLQRYIPGEPDRTARERYAQCYREELRCFCSDTKTKKRVSSKREQLLISNKRVDWGFKQSVLAMQSRVERQLEKEEKRCFL